MRCSRRRLALASELATAPLMRARFDPRASMKKFTVEPVPTPTIMSSSTYFSAASAAAFFCALASMAERITVLGMLARSRRRTHEERRLPGKDPHRQGVRRGDREPARCRARDLARPGHPLLAQREAHTAGVCFH